MKFTRSFRFSHPLPRPRKTSEYKRGGHSRGDSVAPVPSSPSNTLHSGSFLPRCKLSLGIIIRSRRIVRGVEITFTEGARVKIQQVSILTLALASSSSAFQYVPSRFIYHSTLRLHLDTAQLRRPTTSIHHCLTNTSLYP